MTVKSFQWLTLLLPVLGVLAIGLLYLITGEQIFSGSSLVLIALVATAFLTLLGKYLAEVYQRKVADDSWANYQFRKDLAQKYKNSAPLISIADHNFQLKDKENLSKNRSFLKVIINELESNKREFVRQFEPLDNRAYYKQISANYSTILAEYDEALATLSTTLANIEQSIRAFDSKGLDEKRGTPEFEKAKEKYTPPIQPNWD